MTWDGVDGANAFIADVAAIVYGASPAGARSP